MDQRERIADPQEAIREAIQGLLSSVFTALPGYVTQIDYTKSRCTVQPTIKSYVRQPDGSQVWVQLPLLINVPIVFPSVGGFALTLPLAVNDEVLVIFSGRCIDAWWQQGGVQIQAELRMHDISDGFAIPGPRSLPNVLSMISQNTAQLRSADGSTYVEITGDGKVNIVAPNGLVINGQPYLDHTHSGVQTGGSDTGPVVP